ncbi:class I SAM-dependent methyltransferase [Acetobacter fallax]|uniref:S-adenosyl-L-methionine-dependent methyltransferase n=1 Tax=Acetobacter fallax TaxID=1737473 RepID=A0ABX0K966_9PROT|nr:SAM-dependent methyltransferase [Acetobacter fallax]NHO32761.1 SAM-dependent methyltransferase [Acetobacter fallax]NHO36324.1 SAM-dependent methyltransferase [Acetobacter fallax]
MQRKTTPDTSPLWSSTAAGVARLRALHQVTDGGAIFPDPLALRILGNSTEQYSRSAKEHPERVTPFRLFIAARSRIAEDALAEAVQRGVRQVVILGAGLDTFGLRNPWPNVQVFEVDQVALQGFKRERIAAAALHVPETLHFITTDFRLGTLAKTLRAGGVDLTRPVFFIWLGVMIYLNRAAIDATLNCVSQAPDAEIVFDYGVPVESFSPAVRRNVDERAKSVAERGEPWVSRFSPEAMQALLTGHGFAITEDFDKAAMNLRFGLPEPAPDQRAGSHVVLARVAP